MERQGIVFFKGNDITLLGQIVHEGDPAPNFTALNQEMKPVALSDFRGAVVILSSVPSLDTPVCETEAKRFNREAPRLDAEIITISMDLPFAQKRFIEEQHIQGIHILSDYKDHEFGKAYGVYIKEMGLLARAVFLVDEDGRIAYMELVKELTEQPDFKRLFEETQRLTV